MGIVEQQGDFVDDIALALGKSLADGDANMRSAGWRATRAPKTGWTSGLVV